MSNATQLNEKEQKIVDCVRANAPILGETIAEKLGLPCNSWFREGLAKLIGSGHLRTRANGGYCISEESACGSNATVQWTAPDGVIWPSRLVIDPYYERAWNRKHKDKPWPWAHLKPPFQIHWSRLRKLRKFVRSSNAAPVPGRIRAIRIEPSIGKKVCVYHPGDCQTNAEAPDIFAEAELKKQDIQQSPPEKNFPNGRPILSPREVANRLGVCIETAWTYRTKGVPWVRNKKGKKEKPKTVPAQFGLKYEQFWFEHKVEEYLKAKQALAENPGEQDGLLLQEKSGMPPIEIRRQKARGKLDLEPRIGKNKAGITCQHRLVPAEDVNGYLGPRATDPVPPNKMTVRRVAILFGLSVDSIRDLFRKVLEPGKARIEYKRGRSRKDFVQVRKCHWIDKAKVRRKWKQRFPDRPFPPDLANGQHEGNTSPGPAPSQQTTQKSPKKNPPLRKGRKYDQRSLRIQCYCCLEREKSPPTKMMMICRVLEGIFGVDCPVTRNGHVREYKNRWIKYRERNPQESKAIEAESFPQTLKNYRENQYTK